MNKFISCMIIISCYCVSGNAQISSEKFGKGIQFEGVDSSYTLKLSFRFQNLFSNEWTINDGSFENHQSNFLVRRTRIKVDGWAYSPKLKYKMELGLSNRDINSGASAPFGNTANIILDAYVLWNFHGNFSLLVGQTKVPGNRERIISSSSMQFVDRSRLNSRFNLDRDMGIHLLHDHTIGDQFILRESLAITQGEGRNVIEGNYDGYAYTFKMEALPFGKFQSNGEYVGSAIKRESTPKLAVAVTYDINNDANRERGRLGDFIYGIPKNLNSFIADMMFKYQNISVMAEYVKTRTDDDDPIIYTENDAPIGKYYTGSAFNFQSGYMFDSNWELAGRYTSVNPDKEVGTAEVQYTMGLSKFVFDHKLKVQMDWTYRDIDEGTDSFIWRTQMEIQF